LRKTVKVSGTRCYDERSCYPLQHWLYYDRRHTQPSYRAGAINHWVGISPLNSHQIEMPQHTAKFGTTSGDLAPGQIENWDHLQGSPSFITHIASNTTGAYCRAAIDAFSKALV